MGLFDFVKDAGAKILDLTANPASAGATIKKHVEKEIGVSDVEVVFVDGTVKVSGTAASQADKEKLILAAGNVHGVTKVEDAISVASPGAVSRMYTVKSGDTLGKIAQEMYGKSADYPKIFEANKPQLKDPDHIYPGQVLRIP